MLGTRHDFHYALRARGPPKKEGIDLRRKLLIDTDPGVDDALALFLATGLDSAELVGVTTCFGNAALGVVSANARYILDSAGASSIPVHLGASHPQRGEPPSSVVHGEGALGDISISTAWMKASAGRKGHGLGAASAMAEFGRPHGDARTLVAIGPLTNVADALATAPQGLSGLERIVILGGTYMAPGNKGPVAEFNFRCDPEAADYVLTHAPCEVVIVPLDICMRNVLSLEDLSAIGSPPFREFLTRLCSSYSALNHSEEGIRGIIMYDPLAVFCAAHPEHFTLEPFWMRVDTGDSVARGMSVVDRRLRPEGPPNVLLATSVDWRAFVGCFFEALARVPFVSL